MRSAPSQKIVLFCLKWRVEMQCGATVSSFIEVSRSWDTVPIPVAAVSGAGQRPLQLIVIVIVIADPGIFIRIIRAYLCTISGPGSLVGIATELRAGRSGIESRWGRDFLPVQTGPGAHPASCKMGTGFFPGVKCGRGVLLTTHPLLVPRSRNSRAIPLPTL